MAETRRDGEAPDLQRLSEVVTARTSSKIWRQFLVAQTQVRQTHRRREMTTQKLFLTGDRER